MGQRHTVHTLLLDHASSDIVLSDLASASHDINYTMLKPNSGGPYEEVAFIQQAEENFNAVSPALSTLLAALDLNQVNCIESGETYTALQLFGRALDPCGTDGTKSGSTHRRASSSKAKLVITNISAAGNGNAQVTLQAALLSSDGDTAPTTTVVNVALPTGGIVNEMFKLHAVQLESVTLDSDMITNFSLDTGIRLEQAFGVKQYAQDVIVTKTAPTLTIDTEDAELYSNFATTGTLITHGNSLIEFQKRDPTTGGLVAGATTQHVALTVAGFARPDQMFSGSGSSPGTARLVVELTGVPGTPPMTATTGQALTL